MPQGKKCSAAVDYSYTGCLMLTFIYMYSKYQAQTGHALIFRVDPLFGFTLVSLVATGLDRIRVVVVAAHMGTVSGGRFSTEV